MNQYKTVSVTVVQIGFTEQNKTKKNQFKKSKQLKMDIHRMTSIIFLVLGDMGAGRVVAHIAFFEFPSRRSSFSVTFFYFCQRFLQTATIIDPVRVC